MFDQSPIHAIISKTMKNTSEMQGLQLAGHRSSLEAATKVEDLPYGIATVSQKYHFCIGGPNFLSMRAGPDHKKLIIKHTSLSQTNLEQASH